MFNYNLYSNRLTIRIDHNGSAPIKICPKYIANAVETKAVVTKHNFETFARSIQWTIPAGPSMYLVQTMPNATPSTHWCRKWQPKYIRDVETNITWTENIIQQIILRIWNDFALRCFWLWSSSTTTTYIRAALTIVCPDGQPGVVSHECWVWRIFGRRKSEYAVVSLSHQKGRVSAKILIKYIHLFKY